MIRKLLHHPLLANPWVRGPLSLGILLGTGLALWVVVVAVQEYLFYQQAGRQPFSSPLRIAAKKVVTQLVKPFYNHRLLTTTDLPIYDVQLTQRRLDEWHGILDRVTLRGRSVEEDRVYLPATFRWGNQSWQVDMRGRGTLSGHYHKSKPSFRLRFARDRYFGGRRVVNFIVPYEQTRIVVDPTLNATARHYDFVTYPRRFAVVRMNGEVLGVYQEMDHFRKELAVQQGRSEGFLVSGLGEGKGGSENSDHPGFNRGLRGMVACQRGCDPAEAERLLDDYFDVEKLATYAALTTWYFSDHAWGLDNLILFFDPAYGRFEPIPWDIGIRPIYFEPGARETPQLIFESTTDLGDQFMRLPRFRRLRNEMLWDLLRRKHEFALEESQRQWDDIRPELDFDTEYSRKRTQGFFTGFQRIIRGNADLLEGVLQQIELELRPAPGGIEIFNHAVASVEVEALVSGEESLAQDLLVPGRYRDEPGRLVIPLAASVDPASLTLSGHNHITGESVAAEHVRASNDAPVPSPEATLAESTEPAPPPAGVRVGEDEWVFAGTVRFTESFATPDGLPIRFEPGLELQLDEGVVLVLRGDLTSRGTAERPIVVRATEPGHPFATLAVLGRPERPAVVLLEHTTVDGGQEGDFLGVHFSGSFSIYSGSLDMRNSRLLNAAGEDGLNVKYGSVTIENTLFENTASDAVDLDFCTGRVRGNTIRRTLGDGFDFSGSVIEVENNSFEDCADKGLSIGEDTIVQLRNNRVRQGTTGMAVKDLSLAEVDGLDLESLEVGLAIYQKKQVFGSATVGTHNLQMEGVATSFLTDPEATVLRGSDVPPSSPTADIR